MNTFNVVVAFVGIVLGFAGVALTFVTFFAPDLVLRLALKNHKGWREVPSIREGTQLYRHMTVDLHPEVTPLGA